MKIAGISMWLVLGCILLVLIGAIIWGFKGRIEDTVTDASGKVSTVEIAPVSLLVGE